MHHKPRVVSAASAVKTPDDSPSAGNDRKLAAAPETAASQAASPLELMWRERHLTDPLSPDLGSQEDSDSRQEQREQAAGDGFDSLQPLSPHREDERQEQGDGNDRSDVSDLISR
jgi:hypothetical protein